MQASRVSISQETHLKNALTPSKKKQLRREAVKNLINSKPAGTILRSRDFARVLGAKPNNAWNLVRRMKQLGLIGSIQEGPKSFSWYVKDGPEAEAPKIKTTPAWTPPNNAGTPIFIPPQSDRELLLSKAKDRAWQNNSDSLREFIKSL